MLQQVDQRISAHTQSALKHFKFKFADVKEAPRCITKLDEYHLEHENENSVLYFLKDVLRFALEFASIQNLNKFYQILESGLDEFTRGSKGSVAFAEVKNMFDDFPEALRKENTSDICKYRDVKVVLKVRIGDWEEYVECQLILEK